MLQTLMKIVLLLGLLLMMVGFYACAVTKGAFGERHPFEDAETAHNCDMCHDDGRIVHICSNCHDDGRASLDHRADYEQRHQFHASQLRPICSTCHKESFCADCHANKEELKPSDKFKDSPERFLPHRGDYLVQHKIDGRINPAPCLKCHGRNNNARCKACHRP